MGAGTRLVDRHVVERAMADVYGDVPPTNSKPAAPPRPARAGALVAVGAAALVTGVFVAPHLAPTWDAAGWLRTATTAGSATMTPAKAEPAREASAEPTPGATRSATSAQSLAAAPAKAVPAPVTPPVAPPAPALANVSTVATSPAATGPQAATAAAPSSPAATKLATGTLFAAGASDEAPALRALAALWGVTLGPGDPCTTAATRSLRCLRIRGGIATVRQIDRPGVLRLVDDRGRAVHALLTGAGADRATLNVNGIDVSLPLSELARVWRGEYATLWRAPAAWREGDVASSTPEGAAWVSERLATIEGPTSPAPGKDALGARIAAFQLAHGLTPDGLAGPLTMMQLARASQDDEPRLAR
jgi:general secretion pathway protein A